MLRISDYKASLNRTYIPASKDQERQTWKKWWKECKNQIIGKEAVKCLLAMIWHLGTHSNHVGHM